MPQYQYDPYRSPFVGSLSQLLGAEGDIRAKQALAVGNAQAQGTQQSGAIWANTLNNVGQIAANVPQEMNRQKVADATAAHLGAETSLLKGQVSEQQRAIQLRGVLSQAIVNTPMIEEGGINVYDIPGITKNLPPEFRANADEVVKHLSGVNEAFRQEQTAKVAVVTRGATSLLAAGADPVLTLHFLDTLEKNKSWPKSDLDVYRQAITANPDITEKVLRQFVPAQKVEAAAPGSMGRDPITGKVIPGSQVPERDGQGDYTINGQRFDATGKPIGTVVPPQTEKGRQAEWGVLDGKQIAVAFDPATGKRYDAAGHDITATVKPIPPASIQIQNSTAGQEANLPPVDALRPDPTVGNKVDPRTGQTPNSTYQNAMVYALEGKTPNLGFGQNPQVRAARSDIQNKAAAMAAAAGVDIPTLQAEYRANSTALNRLLPTAKATAGAAGTAIDNLDLAVQQSAEVQRTGAKFVNKYIQWAQGEFTPATGLTTFETYIYTAAREYAKVTGGGALSAAALTDSAAKEATKLLNAAQAPASFAAATTAMKNDMANVTANQTKQLANISGTIANFFAAINGGAPVPATGGSSSTSAPTTTPATGGRTRVVGPNGETGTVPAGTALPPGWRVQ